MTTRSLSASSRSTTAGSGSYCTSMSSMRVACGGVAGGQHAGHAVADVGSLADGERVVGGVLHVGRDRPGAGHRATPTAPARSAPLYAATTPGAAARGREVDAEDARVRVRAAQHGEVQRTGQVQVVGVLGLAGEQGRVFTPQQPCPQHGRGPIVGDGHLGTPSTSMRMRVLVCPAAQASTDLTMLW